MTIPFVCKCHSVKPSAIQLTSVTGCWYLHCLPREGVLFWYEFCKHMCCQVFVLEEAGKCESASCTASRGSEVKVVSALPGSLLWAGLTWAFTAVHVKVKNHALLSWGGGVGAGMLWEGRREEQSWEAEPREARGLAHLLPLPGGQGATTAGFDLALQQQLHLPAGLAQAEQAVWLRSVCCW